LNTKIPRALTTFKLEGEVISLSESPQGEVEDNREVWRLLTEVNYPKYNKERKKRKIDYSDIAEILLKWHQTPFKP
jgi:hypothetical protein